MKGFYKRLRKIANHPWHIALLFVANNVIAGVLYSILENKGFDDGVWWSIVTATTVGYGDQFPIDTAGRLIGAWVMFTSFIFFGPLIIGHVVIRMFEDKNEFTHEEQEELKQELAATRTENRLLGAGLRQTQEALTAAVARLEQVYQEVDTVEELLAGLSTAGGSLQAAPQRSSVPLKEKLYRIWQFALLRWQPRKT